MNKQRTFIQSHPTIPFRFTQNKFDFIVTELALNEFSNKGSYLILKIQKIITAIAYNGYILINLFRKNKEYFIFDLLLLPSKKPEIRTKIPNTIVVILDSTIYLVGLKKLV